MTEALRGLPLLSGPPPEVVRDARAEISCRKCNKEFNLFTRSQKCNHCGYMYCNSCTDYQALMPREDPASGYDSKNVCAFCIKHLAITAGGKGYLRSQSLAKLKNYIQAYNIKIGMSVLEKEDLINAIVSARGPNGCLPKANENWYRKHAVPNGQTSRPRGLFSRGDATRPLPRQMFAGQTPWMQTADTFARPDLAEDDRQQQQQAGTQSAPPPPVSQPGGQGQYRPPPGPPPPRNTQQQYTPPPGPPPGFTGRRSAHPPRSATNPSRSNSDGAGYGQYSSAPQTASNTRSPLQPSPNNTPPQAPRNRTTSQPTPSTSSSSRPASTSVPRPPPPVPTLDELLQIPEENISSFSVSQLKEILITNHVPAPRMILEKSELIERVLRLVTTERREREHMEAVREREEWEAQEHAWAAREREKQAREAREREAIKREEQERRSRQETYRTTVEDASASDDSINNPREPAPTSETVSTTGNDGPQEEAPQDPPPSPPTEMPDVESEVDPPLPPRPGAERSGLCVVCQDEDANMVIIDCGHLALCRACADLVWKSTRECPLCRTRIVTEQRLLRVFRA